MSGRRPGRTRTHPLGVSCLSGPEFAPNNPERDRPHDDDACGATPLRTGYRPCMRRHDAGPAETPTAQQLQLAQTSGCAVTVLALQTDEARLSLPRDHRARPLRAEIERAQDSLMAKRYVAGRDDRVWRCDGGTDSDHLETVAAVPERQGGTDGTGALGPSCPSPSPGGDEQSDRDA